MIPTRLLAALLVLTSTSFAREIRVGGSDIVGSFAQSLLDKPLRDSGHTLVLKGTGSVNALAQLKDKSADFVIVASPGRDFTPPSDTESFIFAHFVLAVAANSTNPINDLDAEQIAGIYSVGGTSPINSWSDLRLTGGAWARRTVVSHIFAPKDTLTTELFRRRLLAGSALRTTVRPWTSMGDMLNYVEADPSSIIVIPLTVETEKRNIKVLSISGTKGGVPYSPSRLNVQVGDYPLSVPFYVCYPKGTKDELKPILSLFFSDEVDKKLSYSFLLPPTPAYRQQEATKLALGK